MKTIFYANVWRTITAMFLITFLVSSCSKSKKDDPNPDLATRVSGTYQFSELAYGGNTLPAAQTNLKGTIVLSALSADKVKVNVDIRLRSNNEEFMVAEVSDIMVVDSNGDVNLMYNSQRIGGIAGSKITVRGVDETGLEFAISAVK